jgi:hypothetical protein
MSITTMHTAAPFESMHSRRVRRSVHVYANLFRLRHLRRAAGALSKVAFALLAFAAIFALQAAFCVYIWNLPL